MVNTASAKDQVARLLTLVPYLHTRGGVHVTEAAAALGTTPQQVVRDLKVLLMCGLPGGYPDDLIDVDLDALEDPTGDGVVRVSNADYLARPLKLTPTEATAVAVALRALRGGAGDETRAIVDRVLAKLDTALEDGGASARIDPGEDAGPDPDLEHARLIDEAVRRGVQVRLRYFVPARDEITERLVDPRRILTQGRIRYLDGWCHTAEADRTFRLDRIRSVTLTDDPVGEHAEERDLDDGLFDHSGATPVVLRLQPAAAWVVHYYAVDAVRELADGVVEVELRVADPQWLTRLLLRLAPYARVVDPPRFQADFDAAVASALALYSNASGTGLD